MRRSPPPAPPRGPLPGSGEPRPPVPPALPLRHPAFIAAALAAAVCTLIAVTFPIGDSFAYHLGEACEKSQTQSEPPAGMRKN